jgi:thiamine kinase-like enzyme
MRKIPATAGTDESRRYLIGELIFNHFKPKTRKEHKHYQDAYAAALGRMKEYVENQEMLHRDPNTGNILFRMDMTDIVFIDWMPKKVRAAFLSLF